MFQMALILIAQRGGPNVFAAYYERLLARQMPKMKAIGHMSGKVAKIIYSVLKTGVPYDPKRHAAACGVPWNEQYKEKSLDIDIEPFETEAKMLAGISDESVDIEIDEE